MYLGRDLAYRCKCAQQTTSGIANPKATTEKEFFEYGGRMFRGVKNNDQDLFIVSLGKIFELPCKIVFGGVHFSHHALHD